MRTYDPKSVLVTIGNVPITGYADGTFVSVEMQNDAYTFASGADGFSSRAKSNDLSALLTLTLMQTSPSNDVLNGYAKLDQLNNGGIVSVQIKEVGTETEIFSSVGYVQKLPTVEYSKEISEREWTILLADVRFNVGGNQNALEL